MNELTNEQILLIGRQHFKEGANTTGTTLQAYCDSVRAVITSYGLDASAARYDFLRNDENWPQNDRYWEALQAGGEKLDAAIDAGIKSRAEAEAETDEF